MLTMPADLPKPQLKPNTEVVLQKRYLRKDPEGKLVETPRDLFWRVASAVAAEEGKYPSPRSGEELARDFYDMMTSWKFLPNSPTLMNAGTELGQLSACFVLPVGDSIEEIFDAVKHAAMIHKSGGGTGFSFSRLRPKDSRVGSTGGVASGPVSFLRIFNTATEQVKQGGTRRGANMGILRVDHPDILEFIRAKEKEGEFNNFNLSVGLTEAFMRAVEQDEYYDLLTPQSGEVTDRLRAREIFDLLVRKAWQSGDPGIVFLDRINRDNPTPEQGEIESTNPCGEQPLLPYEACNLGSINLSCFCLPGHENSADPAREGIDWEELRRVVHLAVRFLDNVIDASRFPLERITETVRRNRKIGLGVMGFADLLFQLGIAYDSREGIALGERIMAFVQDEGHKASARLAEERGPFPAFSQSALCAQGKPPCRNATVTTIAPTGTLSIIAGCSSGVEPLFALCFTRNILDGEKLVEINPHFEAALAQEGMLSPELMDAVAACGSVQGMEHLPAALRKVFVTAMDIAPVWHLRMQAAFQRHTDNAVSKTVNLPNSATEEDIAHIYRLAFEEGCKGVTVYRDGCKSVQVLATGEGQKKMDGATDVAQAATAGRSSVRKRPDMVWGFTQKVPTGLGAMYLTVNEVDGRPFEVFATIGKSGRSITAKAEAIGRLVSLALRSGVHVRDVVAQIKGIGGEHPVFRGKGLLLSIPDAIAWVLEKRYLKDDILADVTDLQGHDCPECGERLTFQEGCLICTACGFSRCG
ncbi:MULTISPECIES: vitamin B12-dependent ribonucleotide reductase [unclassified Desulfovibrio]|uniref:vitamin B12-dependent ribonucleotide reductase n=1 Tax=unclassified Desulfovibrio TaxID=2593640 RepID=UPI000F5F56B2|nr:MULTISPECIES: vitamin B12-dependent ribonucleotide reductase [unclassified Desulfovibrio]RRD71411.1 vitamin B12-dependent ribonucleotide reductase [Desulfovibrio sp. OH1209_COT-279]RRD87681.1 vitamin B12-dependent ribonucleotide reductase [Desulfovibrio sp. OH1186_COT-070]